MEDLRKTYDFYMKRYEQQWSEVKRTMETLNLMALDLDIQKPFPNIENAASEGKISLRGDQFVGKALATAVYEYLQTVGKAVGARPWPEIITALRDHGFEGLPKTKSAEAQARENIVKSPKIKLVGENSFGLTEWYPKKREKKEEDEATTKETKRSNLKPSKSSNNQTGRKQGSRGKDAATEDDKGSSKGELTEKESTK